jgi:hypothetical protein
MLLLGIVLIASYTIASFLVVIFLLPFPHDINLTVLCEFDGFHVLVVGLSLWISLRLWNVAVDIVEVVECAYLH